MSGDQDEGWPVIPSRRAEDVLDRLLGDADAFSAFVAVTVAISEAHEMGIQPPGARIDDADAGTWTIELPRGYGLAKYTYTGRPPTILNEVIMPGLA